MAQFVFVIVSLQKIAVVPSIQLNRSKFSFRYWSENVNNVQPWGAVAKH